MKIRCSKLARPMVCAGYVYLDLPDSPDDDTAKEGQAAGELLELLLTDKNIPVSASNGVYFDDDMKFHIHPVNDDIRANAGYGGREILCEATIDWQTRSGITIKGQYDICYIDNDGVLCIEDLKYGWGIVEVKENWQLLGYAIGEVIRRGQSFDKISLKIRQPRPHHEDGYTREWVISYSTLLEYKEKIEDRMQAIASGKKDLQTSDQCKYCMGVAEACPAFNRLFYRGIEVSTEFFQDSINNDELSRQLDQILRAEEVLKIKKDSVIELGNSRIKQGQIIPNYVQVEKRTTRQWNKGIGPEAIKVMTGKDLIEKKFMSPAKAEKMGIPRKLISQLASTQFAGMKLKRKDTTEVGNKIFGNTQPTGGK